MKLPDFKCKNGIIFLLIMMEQHYDIFINNELVSSTPGVIPYNDNT